MVNKFLLSLVTGALFVSHGVVADAIALIDNEGEEEEDHGSLRRVEARQLVCTTLQVTIELLDSGGVPLANEPLKSVTLFKPNNGGETFSDLTTNGNGEVTVNPSNVDRFNSAGIVVTVNYLNTIKQQTEDLRSASCAPTVTFQTSKAKVRVVRINGSGLKDVPVTYFTANTGGGNIGTTNNQGYAEKELFPDDTYFTASYRKTSAQSQVVDISAQDVDHEFQLTNVVIAVSECGCEAYQKPVEGALVKYFVPNSGGGDVGMTSANGRVSTELFPGTMTFSATINKTSKTKTGVLVIPGTDYNIDEKFFAKKMNFGYQGQGQLTFFQSNIGTTTVVDGTFLFPGTYEWKFNNVGPYTVVVSECETDI